LPIFVVIYCVYTSMDIYMYLHTHAHTNILSGVYSSPNVLQAISECRFIF